MKNKYFFRTIKLIYNNAPFRLVTCILLLVLVSSFPMLNLVATEYMVESFTNIFISVNDFVVAVIFFILTLILNNTSSIINLLGSYIWISSEIALQKALINKASKKKLIFYETPEFYVSLQKAKEGYYSAVNTAMMMLSAVFISIFSVVLMVGYLMEIDWKITIVLVFITLINSLKFKTEAKNLQILRNKQASKKKYCEELSSYFWNKETRSYGASLYYFNKWKVLNEQLFKDKIMVEKKNRFFSFFLESISYICYAFIMILFIYKLLYINKVHSSLSSIVVLFVAMESIFTNTNNVVFQFGNYFKNTSLSENLFEFLSSEDNVEKERKFTDGVAVKVKDVSFKYPCANKNTINNINLTIKYGENIAIVGKNGSGKTTLVKLLCGLFEPSSGNIYYGKELLLSNVGYKNIASMFQNINIYYYSLVENVFISERDKEKNSNKAVEVLINVMGEKWIDKYPDGANTMVGRNYGGIELSGGEKQKISLARTLYRDSTIVFFDEPTAAIDPLAEEKLYKDILKMSKEKNTFFITHRLSSVRFADRIIVIDNGTIVENGSFEELINKNGCFANMYSKQKQGYYE